MKKYIIAVPAILFAFFVALKVALLTYNIEARDMGGKPTSRDHMGIGEATVFGDPLDKFVEDLDKRIEEMNKPRRKFPRGHPSRQLD